MSTDRLHPATFERRLLAELQRELEAGQFSNGSHEAQHPLSPSDEHVDLATYPIAGRQRPRRRPAAALTAAVVLLAVVAVSVVLVGTRGDGDLEATPLLSSAPVADDEWTPLVEGELSYQFATRISTGYTQHLGDGQPRPEVSTSQGEAWIALDGSGFWRIPTSDEPFTEVPPDYFRIGGFRPDSIPPPDSLASEIREELVPLTTSGAVATIAEHLAFEGTSPAARDALLDLLLEIGFTRDGDTLALDIVEPREMPGRHELTLVPNSTYLQAWTVTVDDEVTYGLLVHGLSRETHDG